MIAGAKVDEPNWNYGWHLSRRKVVCGAMSERPNEKASTADFEFTALREARNYRHALVREFAPHLRGRVMEVGSGIGQITELLRELPDVKELVAVEPDPNFCAEFRKLHPSQT